MFTHCMKRSGGDTVLVSQMEGHGWFFRHLYPEKLSARVSGESLLNTLGGPRLRIPTEHQQRRSASDGPTSRRPQAVVDTGPKTVNLRFGDPDNMPVLSRVNSEEVDDENDTISARPNTPNGWQRT